jgi:hypothetical protein
MHGRGPQVAPKATPGLQFVVRTMVRLATGRSPTCSVKARLVAGLRRGGKSRPSTDVPDRGRRLLRRRLALYNRFDFSFFRSRIRKRRRVCELCLKYAGADAWI